MFTCTHPSNLFSFPSHRVTHSIDSMPEVVSFDKWAELKPEGGRFTTWIKGAFSSNNADGLHQKLHSILSTSPMWDRYGMCV